MRLVLPALLSLLLSATACAPSIRSSSASSSPVRISVAMPAVTLPGMHRTDATLDVAAAAADAAQPQELQTMLEERGFLGAHERTWAGMRGPFARVVVRAWVFGSAGGAESFLTWVRAQPTQLIGTSQPVAGTSLPGPIALVMHQPSGCCHEETPIYLASWQRGPVVWTIRASGPKIRTTPVVTLVTRIEQEV